MHAYLGLDLLDFFRGVYPWDKLRRLLDQMPSGSHFWAAKALDEELAEAVVEAGVQDARGSKAPPLDEMGLINQQLADVIDGLENVAATIVSAAGGKAKPKPYPRPETAIVKARQRAEAHRYDWAKQFD